MIENDIAEQAKTPAATTDGADHGIHKELQSQQTEKSNSAALKELPAAKADPATGDILPKVELEQKAGSRNLDLTLKLLKEEAKDPSKVESALKQAQESFAKVSDGIAKGELKSVYDKLNDLYGDGNKATERQLTNAMLEDKFGISIRKGRDQGGFGFHIGGDAPLDSITLVFDHKAAPPHTNDFPSSKKELTISPTGEASAHEVSVGGYLGGVERRPIDVTKTLESLKKLTAAK